MTEWEFKLSTDYKLKGRAKAVFDFIRLLATTKNLSWILDNESLWEKAWEVRN